MVVLCSVDPQFFSVAGLREPLCLCGEHLCSLKRGEHDYYLLTRSSSLWLVSVSLCVSVVNIFAHSKGESMIIILGLMGRWPGYAKAPR